MPCSIDTDPNDPGCSNFCEVEQFYDFSIFYLNSHPKLTWIKTNATEMVKIPGILKIFGNSYPIMFGRAMFKGNFQLGMIHALDGSYVFQFNGPNGLLVYTKGFEILACK